MLYVHPVCIITGNDTPEAIDTNVSVVPYCAVKWRELGVALGMSSWQLDIIKEDNLDSCEKRCQEVLKKWTTELDVSASWGKLVDAVNTIHSNLTVSVKGINTICTFCCNLAF